jgi:hypothetical protein
MIIPYWVQVGGNINYYSLPWHAMPPRSWHILLLWVENVERKFIVYLECTLYPYISIPDKRRDIMLTP